MAHGIKNSQQRFAAGWENFIFFYCPFDGPQFMTKESGHLLIRPISIPL